MSFFSKFENEFKKLFGSAPAWVSFAHTAIAFAAPIVLNLTTDFSSDPATLAEVSTILDKVKAGLATASVLTGEGQSSAVTLSSTLTNLNTELASILALTGVKNSTSAAKITETVQLITGEIQAVISMLPAAVPDPAAPAPTS